MRRELLIGAGPGEWRAAWLEDGIAAELYVERGLTHPAGSIHLGRVVRLAASLDAALVDIGEDRPGFLPLSPSARLDEGARVVVQIRREAGGDKGAYLTTRITHEIDASQFEPPAQLRPRAGFAATLALRLPTAPDAVITDDPATVAELRAAFADIEIIHAAGEEFPVDLDGVFDLALAPAVVLPGGGAIHIAQNRAATLIDVDTGTPESGSAARTLMATNIEAVTAIARHVRLRQLGGGIVIDFAGIEGKGPREKIKEAMTAAIAGDPAAPQVLGWTRLGHLELVRPRRSRPLAEAMLEPQGVCESGLAQAFKVLRLLRREARSQPAVNWRLIAAPRILTALRGPAAAALKMLENRLGRTIAIETMPDTAARPFDIVAQ